MIEIKHKKTGTTLYEVTADKLAGADLRSEDLTGAELSDKGMSGGRLDDTILRSANLKGTTLSDASLRRADLTDAELNGAILQRANLKGATLTGGCLWDADLTDADLTGVIGLLPDCLAGADLTRAKLPDDLKEFEGLKTAEEMSKNSGKYFIAMLAACAFAVLTITGTPDVALFTNTVSSTLPLLNISIATVPFFLVTPFLLIGAYIYFHLDLQRLWDTLARLPAIFPNGRALDEKSYPWLMNSLTRIYVPKLRMIRRAQSWLQRWLSVILAWYIVPLSLGFFWFRYLKRHDWAWTGVHIAVIVAAILYGFYSHGSAVRTFETKASAMDPLSARSIVNRSAGAMGIAMLTAVLLGIISYGAINAIRPNTNRWKHLAFWDMRRVVPAIFASSPKWLFLDFTDADIAIRPSNWTGKTDEDFALIKRVDLSEMALDYVIASNAFLVKVDLSDSKLQGALLDHTDMRQANFEDAHLEQATLAESHCEKVDLRNAHLSGADLRGTHLEWVHLQNADLKGAKWDGVHLRGATLEAANLMNPDDPAYRFAFLDEKTGPLAMFAQHDIYRAELDGANLYRVDLRQSRMRGATLEHANLRGANLKLAHLEKADLSGADLTGANLTGANLTGVNLNRADLTGAQLYFADLNWADLTGAHLTRAFLVGADLNGADLREANLTGALLTGADLKGAHLKGADLEGADLKSADLENSDLRVAYLGDAKFLNQYQLDRAYTDKETRVSPPLKVHPRKPPRVR